ncbi:helix-turn-helix domain-containing protein [Streptomyces sp. LX-29]|uniref:helix-turn-helix domain-containing protein n=1 Tax=Streptomyces sp. LX-29 TaxID=2900152 RepID=UPI00240D9801|nr:helix-turn-helix domain-containing protein [Streptomyces sp. LX-29]WFB09838.1 helix-turn-helix domain-containing protein [Streptomyces sp. LX-29]
MPESTYFGARLRDIRKRRGLSQRELAAAAGLSLSTIRTLEQGEHASPRMETAHRLAVVLRMSTTSLLQREGEQEVVSEPWRPLQRAVEVAETQLPDEPTLAGVRAALADVRTTFFANEIAELSTLLGPLLRDAEALTDDAEGRAVRAHLLQIAGSTLTQVRQYAAAETALRRALDEAPDRLRAASIVTTWCWLLVRQGRLDESRELATRWADDMEPRVSRATVEELAAWGWLLLQASAACLRDNRPGEAADALRLAKTAATATGRELPKGDIRLASWGPTTVAYKQAERYIIADRPDEVLATSQRLAAVRRMGGTEFNRHRLDVAKAHVKLKQPTEAMAVLAKIHAAAPEWLAEQRYARDIMGDVVKRRRTLTPEMRMMADAVRLPM